MYPGVAFRTNTVPHIYQYNVDDVLKPLIDMICKFANDTKVAQIVNTDQILQTCLDSFVKWSQDWGMALKIPKCKVLHCFI